MDQFYLYKDKDGNIQRATAGEPVSRDSVEQKVIAAQNELSLWTGVLNQYDALAGTVPKSKPTTEPEPTKDALIGEDDGDGHVTFKKTEIPVI